MKALRDKRLSSLSLKRQNFSKVTRTKELKKSSRTLATRKLDLSGTKTLSRLTVQPGEGISFLSLRQSLLVASICFFTILFIYALVTAKHNAIKLSYEISYLTQKQFDLLEENRILKADLASISSLEELEKISLESLGLVIPSKERIVVINGD